MHRLSLSSRSSKYGQCAERSWEDTSDFSRKNIHACRVRGGCFVIARGTGAGLGRCGQDRRAHRHERAGVHAHRPGIGDFGARLRDKPITVIVGDHQLKADIGAGIARRWYDTEQVDLIVDVPVSAVGLAVQNVANEKKRMFITHSTGAADFHGKFCSPYAIQWVFDTRALAVGTAQEVVKRGGDSWFFITDDYAFGRSLEKDASAVITKNGGKVLGSVRPPLPPSDLSSFVLQAQASKAKIIGIAAGPPNNMNEIKTASEFGVLKGGQQMAALLALIPDIHSLGLPAAQGLLLTTSFYWDMDDKTREWSKRYFAKMNRMPTMWQAGVGRK